MAAVLYSAICSLDGYVADANGGFAWAVPDAEVRAAVNDVQRSVGTWLLGHRTYAVLQAWDDAGPTTPEEAEHQRLWRGSDKVVYARTQQPEVGPRARLAPVFDPEDVRRVKEWAEADLLVGGPTLATAAFAGGLVDGLHLFVVPVAVGGGLPALPAAQRLDLTLVSERRFGCGVVHLAYRVRR
ncbi:dihydrofolate reductase family protein [Actinotalea fermentans]|uniref:Dihydrofolate reductase n=1 Tax=Actinotalea fermentans TaxID=43671 RepID=A0A511YTE3_9CELL|nr:dihydrofolate reductase family protein [Actinotalea fermentans]KGM16388.1 hypothetical protein N867_00985 [Actinotalea fermentans ATCC 43279 = JCM 9966 = DSM 3133]GEN78471.1 dihydrofolate reductase [Actinotalea fermentans]